MSVCFIRRGAIPTLVLTVATFVAGCDTADSGEEPDSEAAPAASETAPAPASTEPAWASLEGPLQRCGPQPESVTQAAYRPTVLRDAAVGRIPAVTLGRGRVVAVLLHQTDRNGLCGWLPFMPVAARAGLQVLAIDLCRYGESRCRAVEDETFTDADQTDAVAVAVAQARGPLHAERVVVVGASMGGSVALMAAATLPGVDAVVDLSGPVAWPGVEVARQGRAVAVPVLVAMATSEGATEVAGAKTIAANAPPGSELLTPDSGHGYDLLNDADGAALPFAQDVLDWIKDSVRASRVG